MRLWKVLFILFILCLIPADASAGPILRRLRDRNAGASSYGSAAAVSACGSAGTTVSACTSDTLPVPMPLPSYPSGITWTDNQGNLWTLVRPAPKGFVPHGK